MRKKKEIGMKEKRGITLVALVVTVVVLLILAGISLSLVLGQNGIITKSQAGKTNYTNAQAEEQNMLNSLTDEMDKYGATSGSTPSEVAQHKASGDIISTTANTTIKDDSGNNVVVPAGFKIASDSEKDVSNGVVIEDASGNQFVWIPVADATSMYQTITATAITGTSVTTTKSSKSGIISGQTRGKTGSIDSREPDILSDATYGDSATQDSTVNYTKAGFSSLNEMATAMRDDYEAMIGSVNTNKGFYVGRYELTGSVATPTEKSGATLNNQNWYNLYKACKAVKSTTHAQTSMIWGCQWDTVCNFIANNGDKKSITDSSSWGNCGTSSAIATGSNSNYKANNIYDIAGNCWEWTQEASITSGRVSRGGSCYDSGSDFPASDRGDDSPNDSDRSRSSRPVLYIK